ncbi:3-isopropylmalate dehydrogenase [Hespellia stercorisuis]|uniref:3-isopropylmalate dehydrogenase n=1 Tax=Hespellia stercorisuis DSM 15480 TaxID=1121950 RepID=A0A1M6QCC9_9FIRM|nr:3-isopropylmalate dehydrogenase [Hespellia stercorisuis]SHK17790.1 hypothetical protein SAMN02745243_02384 [Hespellia stercorisuis DSM 15480]
MSKSTKEVIQWHPAFSASVQIEFEDEKEKLSFESEHLLGKKPMQIDELVIKVKEKETIHKNIGRIFRRYNIIEYKDPDDYLSVNDFYKVYGYTCFYQADTEKVRQIEPDELTITFICNHFPREMIKHLQDFRRLSAVKQGAGIYYLKGDSFPIQLIITKELDPKENRWLRSLRKDIHDKEEIEELLRCYEGKKKSKLYQVAMDVITKANWKAMKEAKAEMCEALKELMAEEFEELSREVTEQVTEQVTDQVTVKMIQNAFDSLGDAKKVAEILKLPIESVEKAIAEMNTKRYEFEHL